MHPRLTLRSRARTGVVLAAFLVTLLTLAPTASAGPSGNGSGYGGGTGNGGFSAWGWVGAVQPESGGRGGGGGGGIPGCTNKEEPTAPAHYEWLTFGRPDGRRTMYVFCIADGFSWYGGELPDVKWSVVTVIDPVPDPVSNAKAIIDSALNSLSPADFEVHSNPGDGGETLVGLDTWFWVNVDPTPPPPPTQGVPGIVSVDLSITASDVTFTTSDGGSVTCALPTPSYPSAAPNPCTYRFLHASEGVTVTASISYTGTYTVTGIVNGGGNLGPVAKETSTTVRVAEAQAIVTGRGGS